MPITHAEIDSTPSTPSTSSTPTTATSVIVEPLTPAGTTSGNVGSPVAQGLADIPKPTTITSNTPTTTATSVIVEPLSDSGVTTGNVGSPGVAVSDVVEPKPKPTSASGTSIIAEPMDSISPKPKPKSAPFGVQSLDTGIVVIATPNVLGTNPNPSPSSNGLGGGGGGGGATSDDNSTTDTSVIDDALGQRKRNIVRLAVIGTLVYFLFFNKTAE